MISLHKKTKILGFTVLQLIILIVLTSGVMAAVAFTRYRPTSPLQNFDTKQSKSSIAFKKPKSTSKSKQTTDTSNSSGSQQQQIDSSRSTSQSTLDKWGCLTNTPGYNQCVANAKSSWCDTQISTPSSTFNTATFQARFAYNTVMNQWEKDRYITPHNPYSEYIDDATTKFNAIYELAYHTYYAKVQSLNSQGCSLKYPSHEYAGQYL